MRDLESTNIEAAAYLAAGEELPAELAEDERDWHEQDERDYQTFLAEGAARADR